MQVKRRRSGSRYPLLIYRRAMDRLWKPTLILGILLTFLWWWSWYRGGINLSTSADLWIAIGALGVWAFSLFTFFARKMAYAQPRQNHLRLVTPFLRLNISYKRIRNTHPADFHQLFPANEASWAQERFLLPFYGMTTVVVEMNSYPISRVFLRLFLAPQMFSKRDIAFVLLVPDWMSFSTELDTFRGVWLQSQNRRLKKPIRYY
jgi:mRNA-degrading endonuclease HigB of HigAB toxin-antitoxin module